MAQDAGDTVLLVSRITAEQHLSLIYKIMPEDAAVRVGESRPRPWYPEWSVHLLSFAMAGLIPPFSRFFHEVLYFYEIHASRAQCRDDAGHLRCHTLIFVSGFINYLIN